MKNNIKFTVGSVQQEKLIELNEIITSKFEILINQEPDQEKKKKIRKKFKEELFDLKDAYILTYLRDIFPSKKIISKEVNGLFFKWIDFSRLLAYLPLLGINNKIVLSRKFKKYEDYGLIKRHIHTGINRVTGAFSGSFTFVFLTDSFYYYFESPILEEENDETKKQAEIMGLDLTMDTTQKLCHGHNAKVISNDITQKLCLNTSLYSNKNTTINFSDVLSDEIINFVKNNIDGITSQNAILKIITEHNYNFEKVQTIFEYSNKNDKGIGFIVKALKENWNLDTPIKKDKQKIKNNELAKQLEQSIKEKKDFIKTETVKITFTEEEEERALNYLEKFEGANRDTLLKQKQKSNKTYLRTINYALKTMINNTPNN